MTGLQRSSSADFILSWSAPNHPRFIFGQSQLQALQNLRLPAPSSSGHRAAGLDREPTNVADLLASCWAPGPGAMLSTQMPEFLRLHRRVRSPSPRPPPVLWFPEAHVFPRLRCRPNMGKTGDPWPEAPGPCRSPSLLTSWR